MSGQKGWIEPVGSGPEHRVRFRVGGRPKTIDTLPDARTAEAFRQAFAKTIGQSEARGDTCLADVGEEALTKRELRGKIEDPESDRSRFELHIKKRRIGRMSIRSLDGNKKAVEDWIEELEGIPLAWQTISNCKNILSVICRYAIKEHLMKVNPCLRIEREPDKRADDPWMYAEPDKQAALMREAKIDGDCEGAIVGTAMGSGLREGEQCMLHLADVHLNDAEPWLYVRYGGLPTRKHPKGKPPKWGRKRKVQLFGIALRALREWIPKLAGIHNPHGLVFPRLGGKGHEAGGYRDPVHVIPWEKWKGSPERDVAYGASRPGWTRHLKAKVGMVERAGLPPEFRWHDLRHTCGTSLVSGWWGKKWRLEEVMTFLGHKDITTTQRYAQFAESAQTQIGREAEEAFRLLHDAPWRNGDASDSSIISKAPPAGVGPATFGLGNLRTRESFHELRPNMEQSWSSARALLESAAAGDGLRVAQFARELSGTVLDARVVKLAMKAGAGDARAAIELAELVGAPAANRLAR